jgi:DNA-binding GntR family transcriptional regulator
MTTFKSIPQESTAELLAESLRSAILEGQLAPGSRLVEQELAEQFNISRGPIREAIRILAAEGLADLRKNRGAIVASPNMDDVLEVYAIRMSLGAIAVQHLAHRAKVEDIDFSTVEKLLAKLAQSATRKSNAQMIHTDLQFQNELAELSGLPRITETMQKSGVDILVFVRALGITYDDTDHDNLVKRHASLLTAIKAGNPSKASEIWQDHARKSVAEFTKGLSSNDLNELFERPLMNHVFTSAKGASK